MPLGETARSHIHMGPPVSKGAVSGGRLEPTIYQERAAETPNVWHRQPAKYPVDKLTSIFGETPASSGPLCFAYSGIH
jgi:hypothetical protein